MPTSVRVFQECCPRVSTISAFTVRVFPEWCPHVTGICRVTKENQGFLSRREFDLIQDHANVILMSRAAVVDFEEFTRQLGRGRFKGATDVFPTEPFEKEHPIRSLSNVILSPHRAGGIPQAFFEIGEMVTDDLLSILKGVPPVRMQSAQPEIVTRLVSKPIKE